MTPAEAVLRVRSLLDENGVTSGYYDDTLDIYKWLDAGLLEIIDIPLLRYRLMRKEIADIELPVVLKPLIKIDSTNTTTIGATEQEYALEADYLETYYAEYDYTAPVSPSRKLASLTDYRTLKYKQNNTYKVCSGDYPVYYIKAGKIGFYPQPTAARANAYNHYYIYKPPEIKSGVTSFVLGIETHELIVQYAVARGLLKDGQREQGILLLNDFYTKVNKL